MFRGPPGRSFPPAEKEPFVSPLKDLGDIQGPADVDTETSLVVIGFWRFNSGQRIGSSMQSRVIVREIQHAMWLVDVATFRHAPADARPTRGPPLGPNPSPPRTSPR